MADEQVPGPAEAKSSAERALAVLKNLLMVGLGAILEYVRQNGLNF